MKTKCDARTGLRWGTIVLATLMLPNAGLLGTVAASSSATIDVTSFGAVGDGRTDSTQAFQEAFDEASQYAAPVHVPPGRYLISDHLQLTGSVQLSGSGHARRKTCGCKTTRLSMPIPPSARSAARCSFPATAFWMRASR